jgi:hypothetical protein
LDWEACGKNATGHQNPPIKEERRMNDRSAEEALVEWRKRLEVAHRQIHKGMTELIEKKDHQAAVAEFQIADKLKLI